MTQADRRAIVGVFVQLEPANDVFEHLSTGDGLVLGVVERAFGPGSLGNVVDVHPVAENFRHDRLDQYLGPRLIDLRLADRTGRDRSAHGDGCQ